MIDLESDLARLPEPVPPATLARTVMARVSRLAEERPPAWLASPAPIRRTRDERAGRWNDLPAWVAALAGLAIVCVSWIDGGLQIGWLRDLLAQAAASNRVSALANGSAVVGLAVGLLLYLAGLFAPLRNRP